MRHGDVATPISSVRHSLLRNKSRSGGLPPRTTIKPVFLSKHPEFLSPDLTELRLHYAILAGGTRTSLRLPRVQSQEPRAVGCSLGGKQVGRRHYRLPRFRPLGNQPRLELGKPAFLAFPFESSRLENNFVFFEWGRLDYIWHGGHSTGPIGARVKLWKADSSSRVLPMLLRGHGEESQIVHVKLN